MKEGEVFKEYKEYQQTRFTTKKGLADFFVVTAIWYMIIVEFIRPWNDAIYLFWTGFIGEGLFTRYITYLSLGVIFTIISLSLKWLLEHIWTFLFNGKLPNGFKHRRLK